MAEYAAHEPAGQLPLVARVQVGGDGVEAEEGEGVQAGPFHPGGEAKQYSRGEQPGAVPPDGAEFASAFEAFLFGQVDFFQLGGALQLCECGWPVEHGWRVSAVPERPTVSGAFLIDEHAVGSEQDEEHEKVVQEAHPGKHDGQAVDRHECACEQRNGGGVGESAGEQHEYGYGNGADECGAEAPPPAVVRAE